MIHQRLGVALYLGVNQADVDVFFEEIIRKQLNTSWRDFEWLTKVALQRVDAAAASVEITLHQAEKGLQLQVVIRFLHGVTVVNRRDQRSRTAQTIARRHIGSEEQTFVQVFIKRLKVKEIRQFLILRKIFAKLLQTMVGRKR